MANINISQRKGGKTTGGLVRIDMTPMVDLGFLLITFFVFTASMSESKAMKLTMPADGHPLQVSEKNVITVLVDNKRTIIYEGDWHTAVTEKKVIVHRTHETGKLISMKMQELTNRKRNDKLTVLIKPLSTASYGSIVNILDDMLIYEVPSYAIVEPTPEERVFAEAP